MLVIFVPWLKVSNILLPDSVDRVTPPTCVSSPPPFVSVADGQICVPEALYSVLLVLLYGTVLAL